nr:MAG TPA: hypothetical protein [Caudoviricetes sp.]
MISFLYCSILSLSPMQIPLSPFLGLNYRTYVRTCQFVYSSCNLSKTVLKYVCIIIQFTEKWLVNLISKRNKIF